MRFWRLLILAMALVAISVSATAEPWQAPYHQLVKQIPKSPKKTLQQLLDNPPNSQFSDVQRAQYYSVLSMAYYALSFPEQALSNAQKSLSFIEPQHQPWLHHLTKLNEAQAFDISGTPKKGLVGANAALIWAELNDDTDMLVNSLYVRGVLLNSLVDYQGALRDLLRAYDLAESANTLARGDIAGMLALVYEYRNEHALSVPFFTEAVEYHALNENHLEWSIALFGLGKANVALGKQELGQAQLNQSLQLAKDVGDEQGVAYALKELARLSLVNQQFEQAHIQLQQALTIFQTSQNSYMLYDSYKTMLQVALAQRDLDAAERYLRLAHSAIDPQTMPLQMVALNELNAKFLAQQGQYSAAFELLYDTVQHKQHLISKQSTQQLHSLRSQYEIDLKDRENKLLEQKNHLQQANLYEAETKNLQLMLLFTASLIICALLILLVHRTIKNRAKLERLANVDTLTALANRRYALEQLQYQVDIAQRHQLNLSIAIVDIDFFKQINDTYGHAAGDRVLKVFGQLCINTLRQTDIAGRIGGEEFVIVLPHTTVDDAKTTLSMFSSALKQQSYSDKLQDLVVTVSIGLTACGLDDSLEDILLRCDSALYSAKRNGRDQIVTA